MIWLRIKMITQCSLHDFSVRLGIDLLINDKFFAPCSSTSFFNRSSSLGFDVPWFHGIFNAFSLSLMCVQKLFYIDFYVSFSLFAGNLSKDERRSFWARNAEKTTYRVYEGPSSLWRSVGGIVVRRQATEGRWTEFHDGPSQPQRSVLLVHPNDQSVVPVPKF